MSGDMYNHSITNTDYSSICVIRCFKLGGRFISITFIIPLIRKRLYARTENNWPIRTHTYGGQFEYFVYVMMKA